MLAELKDHVHRGPRHGVNPGPKAARAHSADHKRALSAMRHCISLFHHFIDIALEAWIREHRRINAETLEEVFERLVPYILKIPVEGSVHKRWGRPRPRPSTEVCCPRSCASSGKGPAQSLQDYLVAT